MENKRYILLKDLPDMKAGKEFWWDIDRKKYKWTSEVFNANEVYSCFRREYVENNPDWFMEKSEYEKLKPIDRKIKGYKAPFDMKEWHIKKGDIWIKHPNLPIEWVETWEPVYEKERFHVEQKEPISKDANKIQITNNIMEFLAELKLKVQALKFVNYENSFEMMKLKEEVDLWEIVLSSIKTDSK